MLRQKTYFTLKSFCFKFWRKKFLGVKKVFSVNNFDVRKFGVKKFRPKNCSPYIVYFERYTAVII